MSRQWLSPATIVSLLSYSLIVFSVILLLGLGLLGFYWDNVFSYISNSNNNPGLSAIGSLANIIIAFIGLLNLLLLSRIFFCEQSERIKSANHQERLYWVRLALANEWESVNAFFRTEYD